MADNDRDPYEIDTNNPGYYVTGQRIPFEDLRFPPHAERRREEEAERDRRMREAQASVPPPATGHTMRLGRDATGFGESGENPAASGGKTLKKSGKKTLKKSAKKTLKKSGKKGKTKRGHKKGGVYNSPFTKKWLSKELGNIQKHNTTSKNKKDTLNLEKELDKLKTRRDNYYKGKEQDMIFEQKLNDAEYERMRKSRIAAIAKNNGYRRYD